MWLDSSRGGTYSCSSGTRNIKYGGWGTTAGRLTRLEHGRFFFFLVAATSGSPNLARLGDLQVDDTPTTDKDGQAAHRPMFT